MNYTLIIPYTQKGIEFFEWIAQRSRAIIGPVKDYKFTVKRLCNNFTPFGEPSKNQLQIVDIYCATITIRDIDADELFHIN